MTRFCRSSGMPKPTAGCDCSACSRPNPFPPESAMHAFRELTSLDDHNASIMEQAAERAWNEALATKRAQK